MTPEQQARAGIDALLEQAGWAVQDATAANLHAARGVAIREFPLQPGHGFADYLLYVDGKAAGVVEAKKQGVTLTGVETQSDKYTTGLPDGLPRWHNPLPFAYQSTGAEARFTSGLDPEPRSRGVFAFHRAETLAGWLQLLSPAPVAHTGGSPSRHAVALAPRTVLQRLREMPPLTDTRLWPAQRRAVESLERSLRDNRPRAIVQMATGSGKTFTAISFIYRLIRHAGIRRVLFLVDRGNLADQTLKEFQQYASPENNFKFTEEFIVQRLSGDTLDTTARVCIGTIQRLYAMLKGKDLPEDLEEESLDQVGGLFRQPEPIAYNPALPIETFDLIVTDECHRSIYNLWAQVLEYFDAYLIGLTATPGKQTFGFFHQNLVMEYNHEMAVADGVNVNYDVYRIRTAITEQGSRVEAGYSVQIQERETRRKRWEQLDDDFAYDPAQLDRAVVAPDQIRTVIRTFKDKLFTEIFPGRTWVPKTLIFAKDDAHAENIVEIVREEFGKGNDFAQKITYRTTGARPRDLINAFRTSPMPRIAVTVDMIATGTDIKPVEIVMFMRAVKSRSFFEQMKGRGVRVIAPDDLQSVTPDARAKDHFVIVDAVGVCEQDKTDSRPMEQKPTVGFEKLLQAVAFGNTEDEVLTSLAGRLARMEHRIRPADDARVREATGGPGLRELAHGLVASLDPDAHPSPEAHRRAVEAAVRPLHDPGVRELLAELKRRDDVVIDHISADEVLEAGFSADALDRARGMVQTFEQFIARHKDEITALQVLYGRPYRQRLTYAAVRELAEAIGKPPWLMDESQLWNAYAALERSRVKGASGRRILTDLVSLVRFAIHQDNELVPFPERVNANFKAWLATQQSPVRPEPVEGQRVTTRFTPEQMKWLEMIRDHIAANLGIEPDDFEYAPFAQEGGLGKVHHLFGEALSEMLASLNDALAA